MPEEPQEDDVCRNFHGGDPESEEANLETNKEVDRRKIIDLLEVSGPWGLTCDQMEVLLALRHQTASARLSELKREGLAVRKWMGQSYERRPTRTGCMAAVIVLTKFAPQPSWQWDQGQGELF